MTSAESAPIPSSSGCRIPSVVARHDAASANSSITIVINRVRHFDLRSVRSRNAAMTVDRNRAIRAERWSARDGCSASPADYAARGQRRRRLAASGRQTTRTARAATRRWASGDPAICRISWSRPCGPGSPTRAPMIRQQDRDKHATRCRMRRCGTLLLAEDLRIEWPAPERTPPLWKALEHRQHLHRCVGALRRRPDQLLDVWRPQGSARRPGAGAVLRARRRLGARQPDSAGLCADVASGRARLGVPVDRLPGCPAVTAGRSTSTDVKAAIAWARANVDRFGGDRDFVTIAGCSAGGHLAALAGLTAGDPEFQAHLPEGSDTSVDAVVGIYGRYDWEDRSTAERARFVDFLERVVVNKQHQAAPRAVPQRLADRTRSTPKPRRSWSIHGTARLRHPRRSRRAVSSNGFARSPIRLSATSSCLAPDTGST